MCAMAWAAYAGGRIEISPDMYMTRRLRNEVELQREKHAVIKEEETLHVQLDRCVPAPASGAAASGSPPCAAPGHCCQQADGQTALARALQPTHHTCSLKTHDTFSPP